MAARHSRTKAVVRLVSVLLLVGCVAADVPAAPRSTMFIGIDVSGSFRTRGYDDALAFTAHYIHAHLNALGGLEEPKALLVGAIGGENPGEAQAFHPIHDFQGKSVQQIEADLRAWFPIGDGLTDFSAFFERVSTLAKRQNLVLAPITVVMLTDGIPDLGRRANDPSAAYRNIDLNSLEYLSRNVTVRVLYPEPTVAVHWERDVQRSRVRMWTVDDVVMKGWREQLDKPPESVISEASEQEMTAGDAARAARAAMLESEQPALWKWMKDVIDFRVRRTIL